VSTVHPRSFWKNRTVHLTQKFGG